MGCLYASQEQWRDEMSESINTDALQADRRETGGGGRQDREDGNLQSIHFLNAKEFLRFQRWNLNRIILVFWGLNNVLTEAYWIVRNCKFYTRFWVNWRHKREMAVKSQDLDLKKKQRKEWRKEKCEKNIWERYETSTHENLYVVSEWTSGVFG